MTDCDDNEVVMVVLVLRAIAAELLELAATCDTVAGSWSVLAASFAVATAFNSAFLAVDKFL